jgi:quinol-cytochrome oxidoreductase complex cytochrome b subunit/mono/diheme cytochrome c family protein
LFKQLAHWLDDRTGVRTFTRVAFHEQPIAGGARWRYVFGSALTMVFLVQAFTGMLLMASYSPSSSTAWASVFYISREVWFGWFIRGIHHFSAQAMIVLLAMHLLQVVWAGAYRRPREFNWWFGVALLLVTIGFGHTGYQLPWDQKGYWATKVVTNIMSGAPVVGPYLQKVVVGGSEFGNQTLTRFYALHVAVLPALLVAVLAVHIALSRRHHLTTPASVANRPAAPYWPDQMFRNLAFTALVLGVVVGLVLYEGGANLDAPADPSSSDYPARPEWYYLSLFQMLKYFPGSREMIGTIVIPSSLLFVLLILPLLDRVLPGKLAHFLACGFVFTVLGGAGFLTVQAIWDDAHNPIFLESRKKADAARERALFLASPSVVGIAPDGAAYILRRDPFTQGQVVLERRCLGCHFVGGKGTEIQTAPDLAGYGTRAWIRGLLEDPRSPTYFGKVPQCDGMAEWKKSSKLKGKALDDVADFVAAFAGIAEDTTLEEWLNSPEVANHPGKAPFEKECGTCHMVDGFTDGGLREAPNLFAWGSPRWTTRMIRKPNAADRYGFLEKEQKMPAFNTDQLSSNDLQMVILYLRGDYVKAAASPRVETPAAAQPVTPAKSP